MNAKTEEDKIAANNTEEEEIDIQENINSELGTTVEIVEDKNTLLNGFNLK